MTVSIFILVALFGLVVGVLSGMFGIGGGTMMIPLLNIVFHLPLLNATATSLFVIAPTSMSGAWRSYRQGNADVRSALIIGVSGACSSAFSSSTTGFLSEIAILLATLTVICYSAITMLLQAIRSDAHSKAADDQRFASGFGWYAIRIALGLFAGAVSGIVGVGGGFIIVPITVAFLGYKFREATALSLLAIVCIALPGILVHAILGHIAYLYGLALIIGTIPGANIGVRITSRMPERVARLLFSIVLVALGTILFIQNVFFR